MVRSVAADSKTKKTKASTRRDDCCQHHNATYPNGNENAVTPTALQLIVHRIVQAMSVGLDLHDLQPQGAELHCKLLVFLGTLVRQSRQAGVGFLQFCLLPSFFPLAPPLGLALAHFACGGGLQNPNE